MQFRRSGQRDERRRRVILEDRPEADILQSSGRDDDALASHESTVPQLAVRYDAHFENVPQHRFVDLLPKKSWALALFGALLFATIGGLGHLHSQTPHLADRLGSDAVTPLRLEAPNGIAVWMASSFFIFSAVACYQIYMIRRHRNDDYRGTYRVWLWTAGIFMLASLETTVQIRIFVDRLLSHSLGKPPLAHEQGWWIICIWTLFTAVCIRLFFEVRDSWAARSAGALAIISYVASTLIALDIVGNSSSSQASSLQAICVLMGHTSLLMVVLSYGRFVVLESMGQLKLSGRRTSRGGANTDQESQTKKRRAAISLSRWKTKPDEAEATDQQGQSEAATAKKRLTGKKTAPASPSLQIHREESSSNENLSEQSSKQSDSGTSTKGQKKKNSSTEDQPTTLKMDAPTELEDEYAGLSKSERRRARKKAKRERRQAA